MSKPYFGVNLYQGLGEACNMVGGHDADPAPGTVTNGIGTTPKHNGVNGTSNGHLDTVERKADTKPVSLRVVIIGAGIGGLTAAIALRRQGHDVLVCSLVKQSCLCILG